MVDIVKRKTLLIDQPMKPIWTDFERTLFANYNKKASCTIDYFAFLNRHCTRFCEFM